MISQTAEYALRAVVSLAQAHGRLTHPEIAAATRVPPGYLSKVLQALVREGIVASLRGTGGGFELAVPPEQLTLLAVIAAIDPIERLRTCPLGLPEHAERLCPLHHSLDQAAESAEEALAAVTIADLLADPAGLRPLAERCPGRPADDRRNP